MCTFRALSLPRTCIAIIVAVAVCSFEHGIAFGDTPPPMRFVQPNGAQAKSKPEVVVSADDSRFFRGSETHDSGSMYDTSRYCTVVLDIDVGKETLGQLFVEGSPLGTPAGWVEEITPIDIDGLNGTLLSISAPLRHYYTGFRWVPDKTSQRHGPIYVYASALPCGAAIQAKGQT